jgi:hypothetical protein
MLIMGTTRDPTLLEDMGLLDAFNVTLRCPMIDNLTEIVQVRVLFPLLVHGEVWRVCRCIVCAQVVAGCVCWPPPPAPLVCL